MKKDANSKKKVRLRWVCDKKDCEHVNIREVDRGHVLFEDTCESCGKLLHEPLTKFIKEK